MNRQEWQPCEPAGCYVRLVEFQGQLCLQSCPMLTDGTREDNPGDVSITAFSGAADLREFCDPVAVALDMARSTVIETIRA